MHTLCYWQLSSSCIWGYFCFVSLLYHSLFNRSVLSLILIIVFFNHWQPCYRKKAINIMKIDLLSTQNFNCIRSRAGGAESARTFFNRPFLQEKRGLEVPNSVIFPNLLWTFRKSKKNCFFHSVLGWSRRCRLIQPPTLHSSNIKKPRPIRVSIV